MLYQFVSIRLQWGFVLSLALILSGFWQPILVSIQAQTIAAKSHAQVSSSKENQATKASAILPNHYGETGPLIRVALATDVTTVALHSSTGLRVRHSPSDKDYLLEGDFVAEARQPSSSIAPPLASTPSPAAPADSTAPNASAYRVEIAIYSDVKKAQAATATIKQQFDQTATTVFNIETGEYRVVTGKYTSKVQASDMLAIFKEAGYEKARLVDNDTLATSKPIAPPATAQASPKPVAKPAPKKSNAKSKVSVKSHHPTAKSLTAKKSASKKPAAKSTVATAHKNRKPATVAHSTSAKKSTKKPVTAKAASVKSASAIAAKKSPAKAKPTPSTNSASSHSAQIIAFNADQILTTSDKLLIVSPRKNEAADSHTGESAKNSARSNPTRNATLRYDNIEYRGEIELFLNERGHINVINVLPMEDYLRGVIPAEISMEATPIEALKAQAVAARSYALANLGRFRDEGFDLRGDARSQVYGGFTVENALTNRAADETRGLAALAFNDAGKGTPIEALYTADCGGRTENSENIFTGRNLSYLRSVECVADDSLPTGREILSSAHIEPIGEPFGHSLARDIALFSVLSFPLPDRVSNDYLRDSIDKTELQIWAERASRLTQGTTNAARRANADTVKRVGYDSNNQTDDFDINHEIAVLRSERRDITKLPTFATLVALATYGENRASLFMSQADTNYILAGLGAEEVPKESRADLALLIKDGILRLPGDGQINVKNSLTRGYVIETLIRAVLFKPQPLALNLQTAVAIDAQKNTLTVTQIKEPAQVNSRNTAIRATGENKAYEVEKNARLFRVFNDESYAVDRLGIINGERVNYHLNAAGRIDFLEVEATGRDAEKEQATDASNWRESLSAERIARRLRHVNIEVGNVEKITPLAYGESRRVIEIEVIGSDKRVQLRGAQIKSALGLKGNPLVIEYDTRTNEFIFTGRGQGHGIGLCQLGAMRLAKQGQSYVGILQHYYTGVSVQKIY
jgi:peptidoglycan hydrolase-like amidase